MALKFLPGRALRQRIEEAFDDGGLQPRAERREQRLQERFLRFDVRLHQFVDRGRALEDTRRRFIAALESLDAAENAGLESTARRILQAAEQCDFSC